MKLKLVKYMLAVGCGLMVLFILLCSAMGNRALGYIGIGFGIVTVVFWLLFGRCPACGDALGRAAGKYCPHCGEKIDW